MKKILFLNVDIGYGGAEKNLVFVANALAEAGHDVTLLTYRKNDCQQNVSEKVKRIHIQLENKGGSFLKIVATSKTIRKHIKKNGYDIAVAFLTPSQIRLQLACIGLPTKLLFSNRANPYLKPKNIIKKIVLKIYEWSFCRADYFVFQTEKAKEYYSKRIQNKSLVIPNPIVPLTRKNERIYNSKKIVTVGRLELKQKRQDVLIAAFKKFQINYPDYELHIYGDGPDEKKILELIGENKNIVLEGKTYDVVSSIENAEMFVLTSDYEGIPNALLEAMSLGIPCISTNCEPGGAALLIAHEKTGLLVPTGDINGVYNSMCLYADNKTFAEKNGLNGMYVNHSFSALEIQNKWIKVIEEFVK